MLYVDQKNMKYKIVTGSEYLKIKDVERLIRMTYWAGNRPLEQIEVSMKNSSCFGIFLEETDTLVGFARVISDYATTYYLCDVIIDPKFRNKGMGSALVSHITSLPELSGLRGILITRDAHSLYRKFGFEVFNDRVMIKAPET